MSFEESTQFKSKATKFLGVAGDASSSSNGILQVQKQGWLEKRPFTGKITGAWQKRYFVLKDSFIFWYDRKVAPPFEKAPKGCLPLGGCSVFPSGKEGNDYLIEVSHPDYKEHLLLLKTSDKADVEDWIRVLGECKKATYENAILGNALLDRLKAAGTALEKEKELAMLAAQEKAETVNGMRQKKWELMKEHMESEAKHANELNTTLYETEALKSELDEVAKKAEEAEKLAKEEAERREQAEQALAAALSQVRFLQKTLLDREKDNPGFLDASFKRCMDTIEDFFDDDTAE